MPPTPGDAAYQPSHARDPSTADEAAPGTPIHHAGKVACCAAARGKGRRNASSSRVVTALVTWYYGSGPRRQTWPWPPALEQVLDGQWYATTNTVAMK